MRKGPHGNLSERKYLILLCSCLFLILFFSESAIGQITRELQPLIENNTTLLPGNYLVKKNVYVKKGATLTIRQGTDLFLGPDVTIIVADNLIIEGKEKQFVNITSLDSNNPGNGFQIRDVSKGVVRVSFAKFKLLKRPLVFNKNWLRESVTIQNSLFKDLKNQEVSVEFQDLDQIQAIKEVPVKFKGNTFANNSGSILITNISSNYLHFEITNNVITRNEYTGRESNGIFSSPLFVNYHESNGARPPVIRNNSICFNYSSMVFTDTVEFFPVNNTVAGSAESLDLSGNYFGDKTADEIARQFDQISTERKTPFVYFNDILSKPPTNVNGHIFKMLVNGRAITEDNPNKQWEEGIKDFTLIGNKPMKPGSSAQVVYHFYRSDTLFIKQLNHHIELRDSGKTVFIELEDRLQKKENNGYFVIDGLYDDGLFEIPAVSIGKKMFLNQNRELFLKFKDLDQIPHRTTSEDVNKTVSDRHQMQVLPKGLNPIDSSNTDFRPHWEIEFFSGSSIYYGDLAKSKLRIYPANARPAIGFRESFRLHENWKVELRQDYVVIVGNDNTATKVGRARGTGYDRNLNFKTTLVDFGAMLEYDLYRIGKSNPVIVSVLGGGNIFFFKPMAQYKGIYYDLRSIGTEGQTLNGQDHRYAKYAWGLPVGFKVRRELSDKLDICFSYTYNKLFTDYLDDVSTGFYPSEEALTSANPDLGDIAVKLSNPNNKEGQRSQSANYDGYAYFGLSVVFKLY
jgi:hypothetical protein